MIPFIDGWAVCDGICSTEGIKGSDRAVFWEYIKSCAESEDEFRTRFGLIAMRHSYIDEEHIDKIIGTIDSIKYDGYYDRMGAAWLLADCMVEFPTITMDYMKNNRLENWTFNKAISKMRESYRVSREDKEKLKAMIRKDS
ncbi:hypothetical protein IMSAG049_01075 [Clostridiales bacterium]|nr:hypothetical protein IMSAG049_01075 [Clostridiales bacterium]